MISTRAPSYAYPDGNNTEAVEAELRQLSQTETTVMALTLATLAVIFVLGTAGNVLVSLVIIVHSQMRTAFNILVFNLAVTDLLLAALVAPTYAARLIFEFWAAGSSLSPPASLDSGIVVVCHISAFTHYVCTTQSLLTMTQMGVIRAIAVFKSSKSVRFQISKHIPCALIVVNYVISLTFSAFTYPSGTFTFCLDERMRTSRGVRLANLAILIGQLTGITLTYAWIFVGTRRQRAGIVATQPATGATTRPANRFDIATARSLLLVVGTFGVSYAPYMVFVIVWAVGAAEDEPRSMAIFPALTSLCSVANPIIYNHTSSVFRRQLLKMLRLDKVVFRRTVPAIAAAAGRAT